jgi:5-formyltetrahydrofolate cyclo-ligase
MSIRSEISTKQLNTTILEMKKKLAFPTIEKNLETLTFKTINSHKSFQDG